MTCGKQIVSRSILQHQPSDLRIQVLSFRSSRAPQLVSHLFLSVPIHPSADNVDCANRGKTRVHEIARTWLPRYVSHKVRESNIPSCAIWLLRACLFGVFRTCVYKCGCAYVCLGGSVNGIVRVFGGGAGKGVCACVCEWFISTLYPTTHLPTRPGASTFAHLQEN